VQRVRDILSKRWGLELEVSSFMSIPKVCELVRQRLIPAARSAQNWYDCPRVLSDTCKALYPVPAFKIAPAAPWPGTSGDVFSVVSAASADLSSLQSLLRSELRESPASALVGNHPGLAADDIAELQRTWGVMLPMLATQNQHRQQELVMKVMSGGLPPCVRLSDEVERAAIEALQRHGAREQAVVAALLSHSCVGVALDMLRAGQPCTRDVAVLLLARLPACQVLRAALPDGANAAIASVLNESRAWPAAPLALQRSAFVCAAVVQEAGVSVEGLLLAARAVWLCSGAPMSLLSVRTALPALSAEIERAPIAAAALKQQAQAVLVSLGMD
jgi:hypothetical protein